MNLDELQSVQARERQSSDLQHLRASFYREVGEFIRELTEQRAEAVAETDDPFSDPEVRRLSDDIETAEQTVEAIYERRVGKVVKKASIAAAGMPVDADGLTDEEAELFDDLVARIERNREAVLATLDGDQPSGSPADDGASDGDAAAAAGESGAVDADGSADGGSADGVNAADLMGEGTEDAPAAAGGDAGDDDPDAAAPPEPPAPDPGELGPASEPPGVPPGDETGSGEGPAAVEPPAETDAEPTETTGDTDSGRADASTGTEPGPTVASGDPDEGAGADEGDLPGLPRTTVRVTADVGEVVGADDRDYDLSAEDVVTLPEPNADVLVDKDAAERLE